MILAVAGIAVGAVGLTEARKANAAMETLKLESRQMAADASRKAESDLRDLTQQVNSAFRNFGGQIQSLAATTDQLKTRLAPPPPADTTARTSGSTPATGSETSAAGRVHEVVKGEYLGTIAKKYGVKVSDIEKANPAINPNNLRIGQKIKIP